MTRNKLAHHPQLKSNGSARPLDASPLQSARHRGFVSEGRENLGATSGATLKINIRSFSL